MLSQKLAPIGEKFNLKTESLQNLGQFLMTLRKQDVITGTLLARKVGINREQAEEILPELVNEGLLDYFIIVLCQNPDLETGTEHYQKFNSLREFTQFMSSQPCPVCDCGYEYGGNDVKVGFKLASTLNPSGAK